MSCKRLKNELKKLECNINYDRKNGVRVQGVQGKKRVICQVSMDIKILSWNVRRMGNRDKRVTINQNRVNPDIICLQETKIKMMNDRLMKKV